MRPTGVASRRSNGVGKGEAGGAFARRALDELLHLHFCILVVRAEARGVGDGQAIHEGAEILRTGSRNVTMRAVRIGSSVRQFGTLSSRFQRSCRAVAERQHGQKSKSSNTSAKRVY